MTRTLNNIRTWLFIVLLAGAPFTFNPSSSMPMLGFVSFRLGLYQFLVLLFVILMLPLIWQARRALLKDRLVIIPTLILMALVITSPFRSLNMPRSLLLSGSILLLLLLLVSGVVLVQNLYTKSVGDKLVKAIVIVAGLVGLFAIAQFIANSFATNTLGLCAKCSADVFGFPRVNGFSSEPQFFASSLLPALFLVYAKVLFYKSWKTLGLFSFLVLVLMLTLSRGGFVAATCGVIAVTVIFYAKRKLAWKQFGFAVGSAVLAVSAGLGMMAASATVRYPSTPAIASATVATVVEHVTAGVITLPYNDLKPTKQTTTTPDFQSPGEIKASEQDREGAASLGLHWWRKDMPTILVGLGSGNLGSYANYQDPVRFSLSFTIYMQYVFMLVELGIVGLVSFLLLSGTALMRAIRYSIGDKWIMLPWLSGLLIGFFIHYLFFGTYINVPYVWLYTGIGLAALQLKRNKAV